MKNELSDRPQNPPKANFFQLKIDPLRVAGLLLAVSAGLMLLLKLADLAGFGLNDRLLPWTIALSFLLLFAVANALFSLTADNGLAWFGRSIYAFLGLAFGNGLLAWLFSGVPVGQAGSYKSLYLVVLIGFLVFISIVNAMKNIVRFAEKEEWNK